MIKFQLFLISILLPFLIQAQITFNLGNDSTYCGYAPNLKLAPNLTIQGDTTGITYLWEGTYKYIGKTSTAKNFLSNVTIPNPVFIDGFSSGRWTKLILTVSKNSIKYKDSINVRISQFGYLLGYSVNYLAPGDSMLFNQISVGNGISPLSFVEWKPSIGVRYPNSLVGYCIQTLSTSGAYLRYSAVVKDSAGCIAENLVYELRYLNPSSTTKELVVSKNFYVKNNYLHFDNDLNEEVEFSLIHASGQLLFSGNTKAKAIELPSSFNNDQIIICRLNYKQTKRTETQKIVIK